MLASDKWEDLRSGEGESCTESLLLVWNQLTTNKLFWSMSVQRFYCQEVCALDQFCILPRSKEIYSTVSYQHIFMSSLKRKLQMWITYILLSGSTKLTGVTHFQPWTAHNQANSETTAKFNKISNALHQCMLYWHLH